VLFSALKLNIIL